MCDQSVDEFLAWCIRFLETCLISIPFSIAISQRAHSRSVVLCCRRLIDSWMLGICAVGLGYDVPRLPIGLVTKPWFYIGKKLNLLQLPKLSKRSFENSDYVKQLILLFNQHSRKDLSSID